MTRAETAAAQKHPRIDIALEIARACVRACDDKKGEEIKVLDVRTSLAISDYFVLVTGKNRRHLRSMADEIRRLLHGFRRSPPREEGGHDESGRWILLDLGDVIVHLFDHETRRFYALDALWADAPVVKIAAD